jgi:hypothetical protein
MASRARILFICLMLCLTACSSTKRQSSTSSLPTIPAKWLTATALSTPAGNIPSLQWTTQFTISSLRESPSMHLAQSDLKIGYLCQSSYDSQHHMTLAISTTHDMGQSWQKMASFTISTPNADGCTVNVNPYHAEQAEIEVEYCGKCGSGPFTSYISSDTGQHWRSLALPSEMITAGNPTWAGSNFWLAMTSASSAPNSTTIAYSREGGPLQMAHPDPRIQKGIDSILGVQDKLYVVGGDVQCENHNDCQIMTTTDGSQWDSFVMTTEYNPDSLAVLDDGKTLIAENVSAGSLTALGLSTDGGHTWKSLPLQDSSGQMVDVYLHYQTLHMESSDGTIYAASDGTRTGLAANYLFALHPGAASWNIVGQFPSDIFARNIKCEASAQNCTLWGERVQGNSTVFLTTNI